jgi:hypothetical protein
MCGWAGVRRAGVRARSDATVNPLVTVSAVRQRLSELADEIEEQQGANAEECWETWVGRLNDAAEQFRKLQLRIALLVNSRERLLEVNKALHDGLSRCQCENCESIRRTVL